MPITAKSVTASRNGKALPTSLQTSPRILLSGLEPNTRLDIKLDLADGRMLQGVDLRWHAPVDEAGKPDPLSDEDRRGIGSIVQSVADFYNHKDVLLLRGDAHRAAALVRLVRDIDFHAGKGQIVCRIEVWYFENQAGGWAAVRQQNRIIRRDRFNDARSYQTTMEPLRFVAELGGLTFISGQTAVIQLGEKEIDTAPSGYPTPPATQPKEQPARTHS